MTPDWRSGLVRLFAVLSFLAGISTGLSVYGRHSGTIFNPLWVAVGGGSYIDLGAVITGLLAVVIVWVLYFLGLFVAAGFRPR